MLRLLEYSALSLPQSLRRSVSTQRRSGLEWGGGDVYDTTHTHARPYSFGASQSSKQPRTTIRVRPEEQVLDASTGTRQLRSVHISKLRKVFRVNSDGECGLRDKVAVDDLDLDMCVLIATRP